MNDLFARKLHPLRRELCLPIDAGCDMKECIDPREFGRRSFNVVAVGKIDVNIAHVGKRIARRAPACAYNLVPFTREPCGKSVPDKPSAAGDKRLHIAPVNYARTLAFNASTTVRCSASVRPGKIGRKKVSLAARSVSGSTSPFMVSWK